MNIKIFELHSVDIGASERSFQITVNCLEFFVYSSNIFMDCTDTEFCFERLFHKKPIYVHYCTSGQQCLLTQHFMWRLYMFLFSYMFFSSYVHVFLSNLPPIFIFIFSRIVWFHHSFMKLHIFPCLFKFSSTKIRLNAPIEHCCMCSS